MKTNKLVLSATFILGACASKQPSVGEELKIEQDPCAYQAPVSQMSKEVREFVGESWPEKARVHSWDTAKLAAVADCQAAGYKVCRHVTAKDYKESTGKTSGPGRYFYRVTVSGEKIIEQNRAEADIRRDECNALRSCMAKQRQDNKDPEILAETEQRMQKVCPQ